MIKMPLQRRLWAVFAVALLLFVSLAASTWWSARQNVLTFRRAEHTRQVLEEIEALKTALLNTETASRGFAIAGAERFLEPYEEGRVEALGAYANLSRLVADDAAHAATLGHLERLIREKLSFIGDVIRVMREEGAAEATSLIALGHGKTLMDQIRTLLGAMEAREEEALRAQADSAGALAERTSATVLLGGSAACLAVGFSLQRAVRGFLRVQKAEEEARRSREELEAASRANRLIMEHSLDVICAIDAQGRFVTMSPACMNVWGYAPEELIGRRYIDFVHPDDVEMTNQAAASVMEGKPVQDFENLYRHKDGSTVPIVWSAFWSEAEDTMFCVARDNTERKRAEAELRAAKASAEQAYQAKSQFLAYMSHELRSPLNAILGFSEILEDQSVGALNPKQARYVSNVLTSGRHLLQLINDILDLAKVEAGRLELHRSRYAAERAVEDVLAVVKSLAHKKSIALDYVCDPGLPLLHADQAKFKQVLYNLLSNAIKFTPDGGRVSVRATLADPKAFDGNAGLRISVIDSGIGLKEADIQRLFREFEQIDSTYARKQSGTGLGLALSKKLIELHGGRIWVESDGEERGSAFHFELPLHAEATTENDRAALAEKLAATEPPSARGGEPEGESRPLVLVVEDDQTASTLLANHLVTGGYAVVIAGSGEEALDIALRRRPFAITMDILLPDRQGWEVLADLKARPETRDIPVVIVSITDDKQLGRSLGAVDFLVKPVRREELLEVVARAGRAAGRTVRRVLIVDDEPASVEPAAELLRGHGCEVEQAADGAAGLARLDGLLPDLVILDLLMPGMNGFEMVDRLRADPRTAELPVLVYTSQDLAPEERERLSRQVQSITAKPARDRLMAELKRVSEQTRKT